MQYAEEAKKFLDELKRLGWTLDRCEPGLVEIYKTFTPNDREAFSRCDSEGYALMDLVPLRGGSIWGTDGGSVGGAVGLKEGWYRLKKSGYTGVKFIKAVNALKDTSHGERRRKKQLEQKTTHGKSTSYHKPSTTLMSLGM